VARAHGEAYHCTTWLLRRAANKPLRVVARRFGVLTPRISHIQRALEGRSPSHKERQAMARYKVKQ